MAVAAMAIEDSGSLCALLQRGTQREELEARLTLYGQIRDERVHRVQVMTRMEDAHTVQTRHKDTHRELCRCSFIM